jgi:hypothetical protein
VIFFSVPADIAALPDLAGTGNVCDLSQAMAKDTTGRLKLLVEQFVAATDVTTRNSLMEQILFKWVGADTIDPASRGSNINARELAVVEEFIGESFIGTSGPNPLAEAASSLKDAYRAFFELNYSRLLAEMQLSYLYDKISYVWDRVHRCENMDFGEVIPIVQSSINNNSELGKATLAEFARTLRGFGVNNTPDYLSFRETFIAMDPELGWVIDSAGLKVYDAPHQGTRAWSPHVEGTDNADAVKGALSPVGVNGLNGDDVLYVTSPTGDILINENGNALLVGGGRDTLWAGAGDDILDGGAGNDALYGGYDAGWSTPSGNDAYVFGRGCCRSAFCAEM